MGRVSVSLLSFLGSGAIQRLVMADSLKRIRFYGWDLGSRIERVQWGVVADYWQLMQHLTAEHGGSNSAGLEDVSIAGN